MQAIEPIKFEIEGEGLDLPEYSARLNSPNSDWEKTDEFLLHQALTEDFEEISQRSVLSEYNDLVEEKFEPAESILEGIQEQITSFRYPPFQTFTPIYQMGDVLAIPNTRHSGIFYLISNNKSEVRHWRDKIFDRLAESLDDYGAMGLESIELYAAEDFTLQLLRELDKVNSVKQGEPDEFEESIYNKLEPISEAFVHNITVEFETPQEPEYDILFSLNPGNTVSIEVEDHSGTDNVPGEDDLIDNPSGESAYIDADEVYTVCKGVEADRISELNPKTTLTNVSLIEDESLPEAVRKHVENNMIPDAISVQT